MPGSVSAGFNLSRSSMRVEPRFSEPGRIQRAGACFSILTNPNLAVGPDSLPSRLCQHSGSLIPFGPPLVDRSGPRTSRAFGSRDKAAANTSQSCAALRASAMLRVLLRSACPPLIAMKPAMGAAEKASEFIHGKRQGRALMIRSGQPSSYSTARETASNASSPSTSRRCRGTRAEGSEVRSVQPQRLTAEVLALIECRGAMELRLTLGLTRWTNRRLQHAHKADD
ncbi:hypothetical protein GGD65_007936 [Bradyrhizobium sp. CIR18]|nr:hypothetical protein [Bradyrhizobium sp. CIR18]